MIYAGIRAHTRSVTGADLPLSRLVSYTLFPNVNVDDPVWTLAAMQWGQIITHDMAMIDGTTQSSKYAFLGCSFIKCSTICVWYRNCSLLPFLYSTFIEILKF